MGLRAVSNSFDAMYAALAPADQGLRAVSNAFDAAFLGNAAADVPAPAPAPAPVEQGLRAVSNAFDAMHAALAAAEDAAPAVAAAAAASVAAAIAVPVVPAEAPAILDCRLHGPPMRNPRGLWFSPNESGTYSSYAPPCNGCAHGVADACIARLAAAYHEALHVYREEPTEENKVALLAAHRERYGGEKFRAASIARYARYT
jgi:hypothetical protein